MAKADETTMIVGDGIAMWSLADLRVKLAAYGLHVVTEADKRVLDEMAKLKPNDIEYLCSNDFYAPAFMDDVAAAELARRRG